MGKHDIGARRHRGKIFGLKLSTELGYDIDDVMGGMIFDDSGDLVKPESKYQLIQSHPVTEDEFYEMRRKIGEYI